MSLLNSIRNLENIQETLVLGAGNDNQPEVQRASIFHEIGVAFGINQSLQKDAVLVTALKNAVKNEPRYFGVKQLALDLIDELSKKGSINSLELKKTIINLDRITEGKEQNIHLFTKAYAALPEELSDLVSSLPETSQEIFHENLMKAIRKAMLKDQYFFAYNFKGFLDEFSTVMNERLTASNFSLLSLSSKEKFLNLIIDGSVLTSEIPRYCDYFVQIDTNNDISKERKDTLFSSLLRKDYLNDQLRLINENGFNDFLMAAVNFTKLDYMLERVKNEVDSLIENITPKKYEDLIETTSKQLYQKIDYEVKNLLCSDKDMTDEKCENLINKIKKEFSEIYQDIIKNESPYTAKLLSEIFSSLIFQQTALWIF